MSKQKTGGLAGVTAGETALCTVGKEGAGLTYRGYDIHDLAEEASFEETAYLLLYGQLPTRAELDAYVAKIKRNRGLPAGLRTVLEMIPGNAHPMDVLRTGVSFLGNLEPETRFLAAAGRRGPPARVAAIDTALLASLPCRWRAHRHGSGR